MTTQAIPYPPILPCFRWKKETKPCSPITASHGMGNGFGRCVYIVVVFFLPWLGLPLSILSIRRSYTTVHSHLALTLYICLLLNAAVAKSKCIFRTRNLKRVQYTLNSAISASISHPKPNRSYTFYTSAHFIIKH